MAIDVYTETGELARTLAPVGSRQLGVRVKPLLRLAMGHKDERGYPVKDDHFTARGDDRAVAKFEHEYGSATKAVEILLPPELDVALTIQYRAFKGGQGGEGGTLVAVGHTNYALHDYCGGLDTVTVFNQDGTVDEIETGLDANTREPLDETAAELGLELYTTLTAMMPGVLGFGSHFALTTKGKESTDNLWLKLRQLYGLFGSKITFAVKPHLVIRSSTARPVVKKKGEEPKRIKTTIYVADIIVPETIDEMIGRLQQRQAALGDPTSALYGERAALSPASSPAETPSAPEPPADPSHDGEGPHSGGSQQAGPDASPQTSGPAPGEPVEDGDWAALDAEAADTTEPPTPAEIVTAGETRVPGGVHKDKTLAEVAEVEGGEQWLLTGLKRLAADDPMRTAIATFVRGRLPETWSKYEAWRAEQ